MPYVSMHESTRRMALHLVDALVARGVAVAPFELSDFDLGKMASALVDAATVVFGSPVVLGGAHPRVAYAALTANLLRPRARFASVFGSFGWGGRPTEQLLSMMPNLKLELIEPVLCKGRPGAPTLAALDRLAAVIAEKHATL